MKRSSMAGPMVLIFSTFLSCSRAQLPYNVEMNAAEEARREARFEQERFHFDRAASLAKDPADIGEARYRAAESWVREGNYSTGARALGEFAETYPNSARAARAWLDAGRAWEKAGQPTEALRSFYRAMSKYPDSGSAIGAAKRIVGIESATSDPPARAVWEKLLKLNRAEILDEQLRYHLAVALESEGANREAISVYEDVARRHPLPGASHSDEALLRSARLRQEEGDAEGALATLSLLTEHGGSAVIVGSYTRTSYIEALLLKGIILRDELDRPEEAAATFLLLAEKHPQSRLLDDALFERAKTLRRTGANACAGMRTLRAKAPFSRYLRCEAQMCEIPPRAKLDEPCRTWLNENALEAGGDTHHEAIPRR